MNWLKKFTKSGSAPEANTATSQESCETLSDDSLRLAMNTFSSEGRTRSALFESLATKDGLTVLNGRYGGEYNNDQLAIFANPEKPILLLGLKVTSEDGDIQLDQMSMGGYAQFSKNWLLMVIHSLKLEPSQALYGTAIEDALREKTLVLGVLILSRENEKVSMIRIELPE